MDVCESEAFDALWWHCTSLHAFYAHHSHVLCAVFIFAGYYCFDIMTQQSHYADCVHKWKRLIILYYQLDTNNPNMQFKCCYKWCSFDNLVIFCNINCITLLPNFIKGFLYNLLMCFIYPLISLFLLLWYIKTHLLHNPLMYTLYCITNQSKELSLHTKINLDTSCFCGCFKRPQQHSLHVLTAKQT